MKLSSFIRAVISAVAVVMVLTTAANAGSLFERKCKLTRMVTFEEWRRLDIPDEIKKVCRSYVQSESLIEPVSGGLPYGGKNVILLYQNGNGNVTVIYQDGGNFTTAVQDGSGNTLYVYQEGYGNIAAVGQFNDSNSLTLVQKNNNNVFVGQQTGGDTAVVNQNGGETGILLQ